MACDIHFPGGARRVYELFEKLDFNGIVTVIVCDTFRVCQAGTSVPDSLGLTYLGIYPFYRGEEQSCSLPLDYSGGVYMEPASVVTAADWEAVLTALTAQISVSTIVAVLASVLTAAIGMVFMWWGVRRLIKTIMAAFRKGKASV